MAVIGTVDATFLAAGVSANNRLYTAELIRNTVQDMQNRLADEGSLPITMLSHHHAGDDSKELCGRVVSASFDPDATQAKLHGYIIDTRAGRDIAAAIEPDDQGKRVLDAVSIRGYWAGPVRMVDIDGQQVETGDELIVEGVDYTRSPGVAAARIGSSSRVTTEATARTPITETVEAHLMAPKPAAPESAGTTEATEAGTEGQSETPVDETRSALDATITALREAWVSVSAWQDRVDVNLDAYGIGNDDLQAAATQLGAATAAALKVLDPDADGDLDLPGDGADGSCGSCDTQLPPGANYCPGCGAAVATEDDDSSDETTTTREPTVAETDTQDTDKPAAGEATTSPAAEADTGGETPAEQPAGDADAPQVPAQVVLSDDQISSIVDQVAAKMTPAPEPVAAGAPAETAPEKPAVDAAALQEAMRTALGEHMDKLRAELLETYGPPSRKGLQEAAEKQPEKPLHEMSPEELTRYAAGSWDAVFAANSTR